MALPHHPQPPYPVEHTGALTLLDGTRVPIRAIRAEDAELEKRFVAGLSDRTRYLRFNQHLRELPPKMLVQFTQLDYGRELALVVLDPASGEFIGVGRYAPNADGDTAEFALTVADAWQRKGIGRLLLDRLAAAARAAGYRALVGNILSGNQDMLDLAARLGCVEESRSGGQVTVVRRL